MQFKGYVQVKTGSCKRVKIVLFIVLNVGQTHQPSLQPVLNMQSHSRCILDMVVRPLIIYNRIFALAVRTTFIEHCVFDIRSYTIIYRP